MSGNDAEARGTGTSQNGDQAVGGEDANLNSALEDPNVSLRSYVFCIIFAHWCAKVLCPRACFDSILALTHTILASRSRIVHAYSWLLMHVYANHYLYLFGSQGLGSLGRQFLVSTLDRLRQNRRQRGRDWKGETVGIMTFFDWWGFLGTGIQNFGTFCHFLNFSWFNLCMYFRKLIAWH